MCHRRPRTRRPCQGVGGQLLPPPREGPGKEKAISAPRQLFEGASGTFALTSTVPKSAHPVAPGSSLSPASRQTGSFLLPPPPHPLTSLVAALPHLGSLIPTQGSGRVGATGAEWGCWGGRQPHSWGAEGPVVSPPPALGIPGGQLLSGAGGKTAPVIFLCCFNIPALRLCGELGALSSGSCRTSHRPRCLPGPRHRHHRTQGCNTLRLCQAAGRAPGTLWGQFRKLVLLQEHCAEPRGSLSRQWC